eukprot:SAG11_NODE_17_length_26125_cov_45.892723_21_plen_57_part_00
MKINDSSTVGTPYGVAKLTPGYLMEVLAYEYAYQADPTFFNSSYCGKEKKIRDRIM